ncbi:phosphate ABC transporter substrate-binding protein [Amycolatopsis balhimycina DSM 5908]|uniref:Phosphate ABC transporter substrate-binding protein n=1 Tax=Amycolatopsis balhimycina DSM 5908 TaxID=1081091 RepID=A0A428W708_AMYBA|nr:substrate-binding domain-containing protein [Amycolatopsis balhimycina]RSM38849.1 phosphate ABC transporter substrate-binding protein [Amycolatopsis balhimycina DSM 5908]
MTGRLAALALTVLSVLLLTAPEAAALDKITGSGSTYVGPAMNDWQNGANSRGIPVNYATRGSPTGVNQYGDRTVDFAGTEAEVSSLIAAGGGGQSAQQRGYQYVPDVAGAVAVMYNVKDAGGKQVTYLHLTREVIGRVFTRDITRWSDPAITATNGGTALPDQPITLVGRTAQSGTTALFYDFIAHAAPGPYKAFVKRNEGTGIGPLPDGVRPIQLPYSGPDAEYYKLFGDSEQMATAVGSGNVPFSIGYDEFSYALRYHVPTAWVENEAHQYTQPFAENIAAALTKAELRPDLSQKLDGVYTNPDPKTYPISAYSYLMMPCTTGRDTCRGGYDAAGKTGTITRFLEHVACDGQVNMARIGYSPLPPNLSQEMMNSSARLTGQPPKQLNAGNCANPTFHGGLGAGAGSPPDPFEQLGGVKKLTGNTGGGPPAATSGPSSSAGTATATATPEEDLANGGSKNWRDAAPAAYDHGADGGFGGWAVLVLAVVIVAPLVARGVVRRLRRS